MAKSKSKYQAALTGGAPPFIRFGMRQSTSQARGLAEYSYSCQAHGTQTPCLYECHGQISGLDSDSPSHRHETPSGRPSQLRVLLL
jgi:hypothetical protein